MLHKLLDNHNPTRTMLHHYLSYLDFKRRFIYRFQNREMDDEPTREYMQYFATKKCETKNKELAKGFRDDGIPLEIISKRTDLSPEEIKAL